MSFNAVDPTASYWPGTMPYSFEESYAPLSLSQNLIFHDVESLLSQPPEDLVMPSVEHAATGVSNYSSRRNRPSLELNTGFYPAPSNDNNIFFTTENTPASAQSRSSISSTNQDSLLTPSPSLLATELLSSSVSTSMSPEPFSIPGEEDIATPLERETLRRHKRREQNRKAQFTFRQKRKDEVRKLQTEVAELRAKLTAAQEDRMAARRSRHANGDLLLCALCKGYAERCR